MALAGEIVLVTAARAALRAIVHRCRADGARVAALGLTPPDPEETLDVADLHLECDVTDERAVDAATEQVAATLGAPSVLVNNAGVNAYADPGAMPSEEWDASFVTGATIMVDGGLSAKQAGA